MNKRDEDGFDKRSSEPKTSGNWMWYLALIAVLLLTVSVFVVDSTTKQIPYRDLVTLLENTRYVERGSDRLQEGATGKIVVPLQSRPERMEISKLSDVRVDKTVVYGTMTYRLINNGGNEVQAPRPTPNFARAKTIRKRQTTNCARCSPRATSNGRTAMDLHSCRSMVC